jgi:hypothetical protein
MQQKFVLHSYNIAHSEMHSFAGFSHLLLIKYKQHMPCCPP